MGLSITYTIGWGETPNVKHPLWNQDMVTRKCLVPNSSIYWIAANIPGSGTLTKPRLGLTSAPNQRRRKPLRSFSLPFIHQALHWETECLFEVILYSELLHGDTFAFSWQRADSVVENNEEHGGVFSSPLSLFVTITGNCWYECKTRTYCDFFPLQFTCAYAVNLLNHDLTLV